MTTLLTSPHRITLFRQSRRKITFGSRSLEHTFPPEGLSTINGDHARGPRERKIYRGTQGGSGENIQEKKRLANH